MKLDFVPLQGHFIRLEPVTPVMKDELRAAIESDVDVWTTMTINPIIQGFDSYWSAILDGISSGGRLTYAVRRLADNQLIGTSSFMGLRLSQNSVEIGSTFFHPSSRGGFANPECKLLMLAHAFDAGAVRVEFIVDSENWQSQAAVRKLGATREGVLRNRKVAWDGSVRDVVLYSVTAQDWPSIRARLLERLAGFGRPS